jgi:transposase InsO family protein
MEGTQPQEHSQEDNEGPAQKPTPIPVQPDEGGGAAYREAENPPAESEEGVEEQEALAPGDYDCPQEEALEEQIDPEQAPEEETPLSLPNLAGGRRRKRQPALVKPQDLTKTNASPEQRILLLDTWRRSGLPAGDFAALVGVAKHTLYSWKTRFEAHGPAGLMDKPRSGSGNRLSELTKRTILMLKEANPDWGTQRISDMLLRGPALPASPATVSKILHEAGYVLQEAATKPHPDKVRRFERAAPNELWQTDLFTFILKRQNRRVYLVAFMDDHSRFIVSYGLHASQSTALVLEVLRAGITSYGTVQEILTDNGTQYVTWRGKSAFTKELEKRGIKQIVAKPQRPQTLGKVERFWGTLWRECLETAVFLDLGDAQKRIGLFIDYYNFQRPHQGLNGLVPADRFFGAAPEVLRTLKERVAANALELAKNGTPKQPFYMTGNLGGKSFSVHSEGERVILRREDGARQEVAIEGGGQAEVAAAQPVPELPFPEAVCPQGIVSVEQLEEEHLAPGQSVVDRIVALGEGGEA